MQVKSMKGIRKNGGTMELDKIMSDAVKATIRENRAYGIPNVFSRNGQMYFELPNGDITTENPFKERLTAKK